MMVRLFAREARHSHDLVKTHTSFEVYNWYNILFRMASKFVPNVNRTNAKMVKAQQRATRKKKHAKPPNLSRPMHEYMNINHCRLVRRSRSIHTGRIEPERTKPVFFFSYSLETFLAFCCCRCCCLCLFLFVWMDQQRWRQHGCKHSRI